MKNKNNPNMDDFDHTSNFMRMVEISISLTAAEVKQFLKILWMLKNDFFFFFWD